MEARVDDPKLVGTPVSVVGEAGTLVKRGEHQLVVALPASESFPRVVEQVTPVVGHVMEKKKRCRPTKSLTPKFHRPPKMMKEEEEVCFICFDGGSIVLCDRKGCPKAYHPACIKRDEAFFQSKAKWDCGWHICSVCQKAAHYMCYTCTYSLCKRCTMDADYVCVRGNKGFCAICMKTIMMIENKDAGNKELIQVDFDDITSWEYLFKMYWILLKSKLSLSLNELIQAKNPCREVTGSDFKHQIPEKDNSAEGVAVPILPNSSEHSELKTLQEHHLPDRSSFSTEKLCSDKSKYSDGCADWGSKELLEFVAHMKNGDMSLLSQFDVQALLLEYIKKNNLRDPRQKSQIICDLRLKMLFGKQRVGHIEMLKLLEYHFIIKEDTPKNAFIPAGIVGCASHVGDDHYNHSVLTQSKKQTTRKKGERTPQVNLDEYAAIDAHNINLIFLRRSVMENLVDEEEKFHDKVVGSIVRIRVSCNDQNQDFYRLVRVVGTSKGAEPYKIGDKTTDIMLEVLNLDKKETMSIDAFSNQVFSEDECRRLRQSIKCGIVKPLTVGEIQMKAVDLQTLRFDDWLVAEILRLGHLRDRANEKGHKKEHRECVEKLKLLKTPEVRHQKLTEIPEVHADPKMNPNYKSEDDTGENDKNEDEASKLGHSKFGTSGNHIFRPKKSVKEYEAIGAQRVQQKRDGAGSNSFPKQENHVSPAVSSCVFGNQSVLRSDSETATVASVSRISLPTSDIEMEKIWHYRDPNGKIQGPFSMVQLQKWSTTGYFPANMRIWTDNEQDHSILLNDALGGDSWRKFCSETRSNAAREGLDSHTCDGSPHALDKEKQSGAVQCSDLLKNVPAYSDCPIVHNNNIERTYVDPLHQVTKHSAEEFSNAGVNEHPYEAPLHHSPGIENKEKSSVNQNHVSQSSGQIQSPVLLNLDLNNRDCNPASLINPSESSENKIDLDLVNLPSHTSGTGNRNSESQPNEQDSMFMDIQAAEMLRSLSGYVPANGMRVSDVQRPAKNEVNEDLPSPTPKPSDDGDLRNPERKLSDENRLGQSDGDLRNPERKPSDENRLGQSDGPFNISMKELGWSSTSSRMVGGAQMQQTAGVWVGSPARDEPSCKEWDFGLVPMSSLQPSDAVGDQVATTTSNGNRHSLLSHPLPDLSSWPAGINEPIEFNTLAEESVSDLLAEVDAMESQSGLPSPSSAMRCGDDLIDRNDCFSSIEELSPTPDAGKSDAVSSNPEIQLPSQPTEIVDPIGDSQVVALDPLKRSAGHSTTSSEGETKSAGYPINIWEPGPDIHPPAPCTLNQGMVNATNHGWATVQGNMNLGWAGHPQGFPNVGWRPSLGTPWVDSNLSLGAYNGNGWDSPHRFGGSRDWAVQGGDLAFGRGRPMLSRQQHGCGGGHSRPSPKGQRVCKFYESGHCKKGAACGYLHP